MVTIGHSFEACHGDENTEASVHTAARNLAKFIRETLSSCGRPSRACTAHLARNMSARNVSNFQVDLIWNNPEIKQWICVFQILGFSGSWFVVDISARINECVFTNGMSEKVFTCSSVATVLMCKSAEILPLQGFLCGLTIPYEALLLGPRFLRSSNLQRAYRVILECVPKLCGKKRC